MSADGRRVAFISALDLTGGNSDHSDELFLFDTTDGTLRQLTASIASDRVGAPSINTDGTRIAFHSRADYTGNNRTRGFEVFLFDTTPTINRITQITASLLEPVESVTPSIDAEGRRIAYVSNGGFPRDGSPEVFLEHEVGRTQITETPSAYIVSGQHINGASSDPAISGDGSHVAFLSNMDPAGANADHNQEVFLFDTISAAFTQVTNTLAPSDLVGAPSIDFAGMRLAFRSTADLTGGNGDGNYEIFLYDASTGATRQITDTVAPLESFTPSLSGDGKRIVFESSADLTGRNPDGGSQIFAFDTLTGQFTQITVLSGNGSPSTNFDGTRATWVASADHVGENRDGNAEVFLGECLRVVNGLVDFAPNRSTFQTAAATAPCPGGKFHFEAALTNTSDQPLLNLQVEVVRLGNGNLLENTVTGFGGAGSRLKVPHFGDFADGLLNPHESVEVPFGICLKDRSAFTFFVDVVGSVGGSHQPEEQQ